MVEWKTVNEICSIVRGNRVTKSDLTENGKYPVISGGVSPLGYIDKYNRDSNTITIAQYGSAGYIALQKEKFWANDVCYSLYPSHEVLNMFLYYSLKNRQKDIYSLRTNAVPAHLPQKELGGVIIPIPSLSEQERIVGILDTFTAGIENIKEQISQRRKQYEFYRDQLLDLEGKEGVEMKTLGEVSNYRRGSFPQPYGNKEWYDGDGAMPFVQVADVEEFSRKLKDTTKQYISKLAMAKSVYAPKGTVIVTLQGSIGKVAITQYDSYVDRTLGIFEGYRINIDKVYFALQLEKIFSIKREKARGGTIKTITKEEFTNFPIPIPSLQEQRRIVSILDTFEASIANLEAQLKQREKQYEYYRNKLLTFE